MRLERQSARGGDSAEGTACMIGLAAYAPVAHAVSVVVLAPVHGGHLEACAEFKSLYRRYAKCDVRNAVFDTIKHRVANACGNTVDRTFHRATHRVEAFFAEEWSCASVRLLEVDAGELVLKDCLGLRRFKKQVV